jgi:hypothetical protein
LVLVSLREGGGPACAAAGCAELLQAEFGQAAGPEWVRHDREGVCIAGYAKPFAIMRLPRAKRLWRPVCGASGVHGQAEASPAPPRPANTPEPPPSATLPTPTPASPPSQPTQPAPPARTRHTGPFDLLTYRENDTGRQDGIPALPAEAFAAASWAGDRQATPLFGGPLDRVVFGLPQPKGQHAGPIRPADGATAQDLTAQRDGLERSESGAPP